tara:strand:+ start:731 stop:1321 length:591 start_codon:yes stop_codon:yes gene_type:complete
MDKLQTIDNKLFREFWFKGNLIKTVYIPFYKSYLRGNLLQKTKNELEDFFYEKDKEICKKLIYRYLARRAYFKYEIKKKLKPYLLSSKAIDFVLSECEVSRYIDDKRDAQAFINSQKNKRIGPISIERKMINKSPENKKMVRELFSDSEQCDLIRKWIIKKKVLGESTKDNSGRLYRFLRGKGFDEHLIRQELFIS